MSEKLDPNQFIANPGKTAKGTIEAAEAQYAEAVRKADAAKKAADAAIANATSADQIAKAKADAENAILNLEKTRIELEALRVGGAPITEGQGKAGSFYSRMLSSEQSMQRLKQDPDSLIGKTAYEISPGLTAKVSTSERTLNRDYIKNFLMASLRKESGAVIAPFELTNQYQIYFPSADASPAEIEAKRQQRLLAIANMRGEAGPAGVKADAALLEQGFVPYGMEKPTETEAPAPTNEVAKNPVAGAGAETTTVEVPKEFQAALMDYVNTKGKNLDAQDFQAFFNNTAKKYNYPGMITAEEAKSNVDAILGGARYGGARPPERPLTAVERGVNEALLSAPGAAATGVFNATTLGIPGLVSEDIGRSTEGVREGNPGWYTAGDIAGSAAMTALGGAGLKAVGVSAPKAEMLADLIYSASTGATGAPEGDRISGAITNSIFSGIGSVAPTAVQRVLKPNTDPNISLLREAGVRLTPAQTIGGRFDTTEEAASRLLLGGGDVAIAARKRAFNDFNTAWLNKAGNYIGFQLPSDLKPHARMRQMGEAFDNQYDNIRAQMSVAPDQELLDDIANLQAMIDDGVTFTPDNASRLKKLLDDQLKRRTANPIDGGEYKDLQSLLKKRRNAFAKAGNQELADGVENMQAILDNAARRRSPPEVVDMLDQTDRGFALFATAQEAARMAGNKPGEFSPAQILSRQRATDTRARSRAFIEGEREGQDLAEAANEVLGNVMPSSGTTERLAAGLGVTSLGSYFAPSLLVPNAMIGLMNAPGVRDVLPKVFAGKRPKMVEGLGSLIEKRKTPLSYLSSAAAQQFNPTEQTPEDYATSIAQRTSPTYGALAAPEQMRVSALRGPAAPAEVPVEPRYDPQTDTYILPDGRRVKSDGTLVEGMYRGGLMALAQKYR